MEIRVISSLTAEDEDEVAVSILTVVRRVLDRLPIAYSIRMETTARKCWSTTRGADAARPHRYSAAIDSPP